MKLTKIIDYLCIVYFKCLFFSKKKKHQDEGEHPITTALRESKEETGLDASFENANYIAACNLDCVFFTFFLKKN